MQPKVLVHQGTDFSLARTFILAGNGLIAVGLSIAILGSIYNLIGTCWLPHFVAFLFLLGFGCAFIKGGRWLDRRTKRWCLKSG